MMSVLSLLDDRVDNAQRCNAVGGLRFPAYRVDNAQRCNADGGLRFPDDRVDNAQRCFDECIIPPGYRVDNAQRCTAVGGSQGFGSENKEYPKLPEYLCQFGGLNIFVKSWKIYKYIPFHKKSINKML